MRACNTTAITPTHDCHGIPESRSGCSVVPWLLELACNTKTCGARCAATTAPGSSPSAHVRCSRIGDAHGCNRTNDLRLLRPGSSRAHPSHADAGCAATRVACSETCCCASNLIEKPSGLVSSDGFVICRHLRHGSSVRRPASETCAPTNRSTAANSPGVAGVSVYGARSRDRTCGSRVKSPLLYRLSYARAICFGVAAVDRTQVMRTTTAGSTTEVRPHRNRRPERMAPRDGIEPPTCALTVRRSTD